MENLSVRPRTVRPLTADPSAHWLLDCPVDRADCPRPSGRGPSSLFRGPSAGGFFMLADAASSTSFSIALLSLTFYSFENVFCGCCHFDFERRLSESLCGDQLQCLPLGIKILHVIYSNILTILGFIYIGLCLFMDRSFIKLFGGICYSYHHVLTEKIWSHCFEYISIILQLNDWSILGIQNRPWSVAYHPLM
jgi:hypothetical protein